MTEELRRPTAVTFACVAAAIVAFFVLTDSLSLLSNWGSLELQEGVTTVLEEADLAASVSLDTMLAWLRVAMYVVVVLAIATLVFAIYAMRGDRGSRIALSVLCGGSALTLMLGGVYGLLPAIVLVMVVFVLWSPESRVWFELKNGRTPSPALVARARARRGLAPNRSADVDAVTGRGPAPGQPPLPPGAVPPGPQGSPPRVSGVAPPPPGPYPGPHPGYGAPQAWPLPRSTRVPMPPALVGAAITMLVGSLMTAFMTGATALVYGVRAAAPAWFAEEYGTERLLVDGSYGVGGSVTADAIAAVVAGLLALVALASAAVGVALLFQQKRLVTTALGLAALGAVGSAIVAVTITPALLITSASLVTYLLLRNPLVRSWASSS